MLVHSRNPGKHLSLYTQFATIRKQRSAFSNLYIASLEVYNTSIMINTGVQSNGILTSCPTNSQWFVRWSLGCETRMGYSILKQNQAITINMLKGLVKLYKDNIKKSRLQNLRMLECYLGFCILNYILFCFTKGK